MSNIWYLHEDELYNLNQFHTIVKFGQQSIRFYPIGCDDDYSVIKFNDSSFTDDEFEQIKKLLGFT